MCQGFGVFVSPEGKERYTGQWEIGKKHGYGRCDKGFYRGPA